MRNSFLFVAFALLLNGCSSSPEPTATPTPAAAPTPAPVPDHTSLFPDAGKISTSIVPDRILGIKALPGGSLAEYNVKGKKYQMFIIDADSAQNAAFMMLDIKAALQKDPEPQYISYMGGYAGMFGDQPLYCFAKLHYLAGIVGLPKDQADRLMIKLAAQLD